YLTLEKYVDGMRRVAAMTELSRSRYVLHPASFPIGSMPHALDLFPDWRPEEIDELFACPLFEHKGQVAAEDIGSETDFATAAVGIQIRPGQLPSYLAASWLSRVFTATGLEEDVTCSLV